MSFSRRALGAIVLLLFVAFSCNTSTTHAAPPPPHRTHWTLCTILNATGAKSCRHFPMHYSGKTYGRWHGCTDSAAYTWCITHPFIQPRPRPNVAGGGGPTHWTVCIASGSDYGCTSYPMPNHPVAYGYWMSCATRGPAKVCTTYPYLKPRALTVRLWITGYSYGVACGDVNGITADGSVPQVGDVASDNPAYWHHHIYVPSLNYSGYVNDRGVGTGGMDLFAPDCATTYSYTGWRDVQILP